MPFEVPKGWAFGYGKDLFAPMQSIKPSSDTFYYADIESVDNTTNTLSAKIIKKEFAPSRASRYCEKGDLLFSMVRPYLKNIAMVNISNCIASTGFYICHSNGSLDKDYLFRMMLSDYVVNGLNTYMKGDNSPSINKINIDTFLFPVPPLAEQKRIMAEINRWFALIDTIEQGKENLEISIKQAKSKILDLAIHGKLVPQDPSDEPASELLKRINPKAQITCDNEHSRKLPQSWIWVKGKNIFAPMKSTKPTNEKFQYIDIDSIDNKRQIISEVKTIKTVNAPSRANRYTQKNDVVFSMVRPYLRNIAKVTNDNCIASTGFYVCSSIPQILHPDYCYYLMISDNVVNGLNQFMKGDNSPSINKGHIDEWLFPLPPLAEQQRIVQKIEKMFFILDDIQNALEV